MNLALSWRDQHITALEAALKDAENRADHAERKWHGWHIFTGTYGITCPLCEASDG